MAECTHDCSSCGADCASRKQSKESMIEKLRDGSKIGKVIAVVSGKGGVGKSLVTSLLAINAQRKGLKTCILDADITGPSIPKIFGLNEGIVMDESGEAMKPAQTKTGIKVMSLNLLLPDESDPVVWRGPVIGGCVKQFWTDVSWGENDVMFIDMPPGTGDVPLTVFQSLPVDGMIIVTSPQDLVSMIVGKAVKMAKMMNIPILGLVENYSYFKCDECGKEHRIYGESKVDVVAAEHNIPKLDRLPIDPKLAFLCDAGALEFHEYDFLADMI